MNPDNDYPNGLFPSIIYCQEKLNQWGQDIFAENDKLLVLPQLTMHLMPEAQFQPPYL